MDNWPQNSDPARARIQQVYCTLARLHSTFIAGRHIFKSERHRYAGETQSEGPSVYYLRTPNFPLSAASLAPFWFEKRERRGCCALSTVARYARNVVHSRSWALQVNYIYTKRRPPYIYLFMRIRAGRVMGKKRVARHLELQGNIIEVAH